MKRIMIVIAVLLTVGNATAQNNVKKAMEDLANDKSVVKVLNKKYEHDMGGEEETYCYYSVLQLDKAQASKLIGKVEEAFDKDASVAYYALCQTPKIQADERSNVQYGPNLEYSVTFGSKKDHNYRVICTENPDNASKRYAYAMVWYDDSGGVRCLLYQIYGKRPGKSTGMRLTSLKGLDNWSNWADRIHIVDGKQIRLLTDNGEIEVGDAGIGEITDDADFLLCFGNLRVAFLDAIMDAGKKTLQTGIAMKMMKLCKKHANLLNEREKSTCRTSIAEMKKSLRMTLPDTFIDGILVEADDALK